MTKKEVMLGGDESLTVSETMEPIRRLLEVMADPMTSLAKYVKSSANLELLMSLKPSTSVSGNEETKWRVAREVWKVVCKTVFFNEDLDVLKNWLDGLAVVTDDEVEKWIKSRFPKKDFKPKDYQNANKTVEFLLEQAMPVLAGLIEEKEQDLQNWANHQEEAVY